MQTQGVEASYLGGSSLELLAWKYAPQRSDVIDRFRSIDDRYELFRGSIGGLEQDGLLVGAAEEDMAKQDKSTLVSVNLVTAKLTQELGAATVLDSRMSTLFTTDLIVSQAYSKQCTKHVETVSYLSSPSSPFPRACSPTKHPRNMWPSTLPSTETLRHLSRTLSE